MQQRDIFSTVPNEPKKVVDARLYGVLKDICDNCGGVKYVASLMRPEMDTVAAMRWLNTILNPKKEQKPSPDQVDFILTLAVHRNYMEGFNAWLRHLGCKPTEKLDLEQERIESQQRVNELFRATQSALHGHEQRFESVPAEDISPDRTRRPVTCAW